MDSTESKADPAQWPNITASIDDFEAYGRHFGATHAELKRIPDGLSLQAFTAKTAAHELTATGSWTNPPTGQRGALKLKLESTDLQQTLQDLGYGPGVAAKHALLEADVRFPGAPNSTLLGRLNGTVSIQIDDGQLLSVQPGAGRIFGLLSVAALPRRLSLDFTDFTDKGLAFDSIHGDFTLKAGDAYTENLLLKGPAAEIGIVGRTGLAQRDYDQTAVVTGSFGQSLPVAGALAAGPVGRRGDAGLLADLQGAAQGHDARLLSHHGPVGQSGRAARRRIGQRRRPTTRCARSSATRKDQAMTTIAAIQMSSGPDVAQQPRDCRRLLGRGGSARRALAGLPENFAIMGRSEADKIAVAEPDGDGPIQEFLARAPRGASSCGSSAARFRCVAGRRSRRRRMPGLRRRR